MRNKRAKYIRRMAESITQGKPNVAYQDGTPPYFRTDPQQGGYLGPVVFIKVSKGIPTQLDRRCTRAKYKGFKKFYTTECRAGTFTGSTL
jgi:hypothetical protein